MNWCLSWSDLSTSLESQRIARGAASVEAADFHRTGHFVSLEMRISIERELKCMRNLLGRGSVGIKANSKISMSVC